MKKSKMEGGIGWIALSTLFLFSFSFPCLVDSVRPQLQDSEYWTANSFVSHTEFDVLVARLDFDEDLYVAADSFLCGKAEKACLPTGCTPCDWSGQNPEGCQNPSCCGPSEVGGELYDRVDEWCGGNNVTTNYTSLKHGEPSSSTSLDEGEIAYFRFFVGSEHVCRPFKVVVKPFYGVPIVRVSNLHAFPDTENSEWKRGSSPISSGLAQNYVTICPVAHTNYRLGTYSIAVQAALATSFTVEVVVSSQAHPLFPPSIRLPCSGVDQSDYSPDAAEHFCLEDGLTVSHSFTNSRNKYSELILPVPTGCSTLSVSATLEDSDGEVDLFCLPRNPDQLTTRDNALIGRAVSSENRLSFSACFEETTYVHCSILPQTDQVVHMIFSTVSLPYRVPLQSHTSTSLTYQDALTSASPVLFGVAQGPCIDFLADCYEWVPSPTTDPLIFFPPPSQLPRFNAPLDLDGEYTSSGVAEPLGRTLFVVTLLSVADETIYSENQLVPKGSIAVLSITNQFGEVVQLPGGGVDSSNEQSVSKYVPHIPISSIDRVDLADFCDNEKYLTYQGLVTDLFGQLEITNTVEAVQTISYASDVYNFGLAGSSCLTASQEKLGRETENVSRTDQTFCRYNQVQQWLEWESDPCCNDELSPLSCCFPFAAEVLETPYVSPTESELQGMCGIPQCATSYYDDLTKALNQLNDPVQGCSLGIQDPEYALADLVYKQYEQVVRFCLDRIGFGEGYSGTSCLSDEDCQDAGDDDDDHRHHQHTCDQLRKKCTLPDTATMEHNYLECYIERMPSSLEDYIRRAVLPRGERDLPRGSERFYLAVQEAASVNDCIDPNDALNIGKRARYVWDAEEVECKAEELGVLEENLKKINELCPPGVCLGQSCQEDYGNCFANCNTKFTLHTADEQCSPDPICTVADLDSCESSHCVFCPSNHTFPCTLIPGVEESECLEGIGCELPDGRVMFGLTEEECREKDASCTVDCPGQGCQSLSESTGICVVDATLSFPTCQNVQKSFGIPTEWLLGGTCKLELSTQDDCDEFEEENLLATTWRRCEDVGVGECGEGGDSVQRYLECYLSDWRECPNKGECEDSGECSDRQYSRIVRSETGQYPISVQTGACFNSGFDDAGGRLLPTCRDEMDRPGIGCRDVSFQESSQCEGTIDSGGVYSNREWVLPAFSEKECVNDDDRTRFGCLLPGPEKQLLWLDSEECKCRGGEPQHTWEWRGGEWRGGTPRSLTWVEAQIIPQYEEQRSLSFLELESWVAKSVEEQFLYLLRSEVICQSNFVSYSLNTLVCDCFSGDNSDDTDCYNNENREILVAISALCAGERSATKGPSSRATFYEDSISSGCSQLNFSLVNQAWFDAEVPDVAVSFRFEDHKTRGTVRNSNEATVGELVGDGTVISFEETDDLETFLVCLQAVGKGSGEYSVSDFGVSSSDYEVIRPLGLSGIEKETVGSIEFWCANVSYREVVYDSDGVVRLFPVYREPHFEDDEAEYVSDKTKSLMYVLGCFYAIDLILFIYYFIHKAVGGSKSVKRRQISFPLSFLFAILCVFRICFMFMYPKGVFYEEPLAEFVVFEIPTFLLFTMVIISIGFWKSLSNRKNFFMRDSTVLVYVGVALVWCLWVVVTVVYAKVILETDSGKSPCVGRVPDSTSELEENTRVLAIVYQSIIITVTFFLATIFLIYTKKLLSAAKNLSRVKKFIIFIGGLITFSFLARCFLYVIILAVDFTSSIYMFCVLFTTEASMMFLCALQFNSLFISSLGGGSSGSSSTNMSSRSRSRVKTRSGSQKSRIRTDLTTATDD